MSEHIWKRLRPYFNVTDDMDLGHPPSNSACCTGDLCRLMEHVCEVSNVKSRVAS